MNGIRMILGRNRMAMTSVFLILSLIFCKRRRREHTSAAPFGKSAYIFGKLVYIFGGPSYMFGKLVYIFGGLAHALWKPMYIQENLRIYLEGLRINSGGLRIY